MKLKVCGMKYSENINQIASLQPDYMGFIFYKSSLRNLEDQIPKINKNIKKVGVFVDASLEFVIKKVESHSLDAIQLHGKESADYCEYIKSNTIHNDLQIIKAFSIKDTFDFKLLDPYENSCDYFLFDTKGKLPGGNGYVFNWEILNKYPSTKPYFLSGGIGLGVIENLKRFLQSSVSKQCYAIDVNSRFEISPGLKNMEQLKLFKAKLL